MEQGAQKVMEETNPENQQIQNDTLSSSKGYQKALDLAEAGNYDEALAGIQEYLRSVPNDAEALNDTGAILHCLGRSGEAIEHFVKARSLDSQSAEIIWNLSEAYLATDKAAQSAELFDEMERIGILSADVLNRAADAFLKEENLSDALGLLRRSLEISPDQEIVPPMIEVIRCKIEDRENQEDE